MRRRRIEWQSRLMAIFATIILDKIHVLIFGNPDNTPEGVTVYVCGAATINILAFIYYATALSAKLSFDLLRLAFCAIALNLLGWLVYIFPIVPPKSVNFLVLALNYGMFFRIFWISDGDSDAGGWGDFVGRIFDRSRIIHSKEAQS